MDGTRYLYSHHGVWIDYGDGVGIGKGRGYGCVGMRGGKPFHGEGEMLESDPARREVSWALFDRTNMTPSISSIRVNLSSIEKTRFSSEENLLCMPPNLVSIASN